MGAYPRHFLAETDVIKTSMERMHAYTKSFNLQRSSFNCCAQQLRIMSIVLSTERVWNNSTNKTTEQQNSTVLEWNERHM